jgi:hypothetical protein
MVGENYRNLRKQTGNMETAHALIVKNSSNDNICLLPRFQLFSDGFNIPLHGHPFFGIFPGMGALFQQIDGCTER